MGIEHKLNLINDGEPVAAGTANRAPRQIHQNVEYLWECIQAAQLGSTIYARQVTVEADAQVGMPVYLNATTQRFERALANVESDPLEGYLTVSASSQVWGVVAAKHNATLADLLLYGYADLDLAVAVGSTPTPGPYYLSGVQAGKLVRQRPPVSVAVLRAGVNGKVFVNPTFIDFLDSHRHYRFELICAPAGETTPPTPGDRHIITNPNADWPGWLPASHASFAGRAPAGAAFGYNLNEHPVLQSAWPPLPVQNVYLEWDRGDDPTHGFEGVPLGTGGLVIVNRDGIWWMSDCYGDVPWPTNLDTSYGESISAPPHDHATPECPRETRMALALWFTKLNFLSDATVVTSLTSVDDRLKIHCAGTSVEGSRGDLEIDLDLSLLMGGDTARGYLAFKALSDERFERGPIVEGIYAGTPNVSLSGPLHTPVDPDDPTGTQMYHGPVALSVLPSAVQELQCQLVRLEGATEESNPVLYIELPNDVETSFTARFEVPVTAPANSKFALRARILGSAAGTLPQLTIAYLVCDRPTSGLATPVSISATYTALTMVTIATLTGANQAVEANSSQITVQPGNLVYVRITRTPEDVSDGYAGAVGFVQQVGILTAT